MRLLQKCLIPVLLCLAGATSNAATVNVGGVRLDDSITVAGTRLVLNGAGIRYKAVFKDYAAALYVGRKVASQEEVLAAPGPKRLSVTMLREMDSAELGRLFARGIEDNMDKASFSRIVPGVVQLGQIFAENRKLLPGDNFMLEWVPGLGTVITLKGVPQGEPAKEPEFFDALMRIWLGRAPTDWKLKDALLGKSG